MRLRNSAKLEAILDYSKCPMKFAYAHVYKVSADPPTNKLFWIRTVERALKTLAREKLRQGYISIERTQLLWQVYTKNTIIEAKPKLNSSGRDVVNTFREWLDSVQLLGIAIPRAIPIQLSDKETLEIHSTADLITDKGLLSISTNSSHIESAILAEDSEDWTIFNVNKQSWKRPTSQPWLKDSLKQISRGMFRTIVWAHRDSRCNSCEYSGICSNEDVNSSRSKVQKRLG